MKKRTKTLLTVLCAVTLAVVSVIGTYAYLTATSGPVKNTFIAGKIPANLVLEEHKANQKDDGTYELDLTADAVKENSYVVTPGNTLPKDPYVTVGTEGEETDVEMFLFIDVEDTLTVANKVTWVIDDAHWIPLKDANDAQVMNGTKPVYVYTVDKSNAARFKGALDADDTNIIKDKQVVVVSDDFIPATSMQENATLQFNAYLCQADTFASAYAAWNACFVTTNP